MLARILVAALACYFLGNHNGAICVSAMLGDDVRSHGSGNAGLTNFIRNYGASRSALVIAIDVLKAVLACALGGLMFPEDPLLGKTLGGVCVMLGGIFMSALTTFQHRGNIVRLLKGQERKTNLLSKGKKQ